MLKDASTLRAAGQGQTAKDSGKNGQRAKKGGLMRARRRECERSRNLEIVQAAHIQVRKAKASKPVLHDSLSQASVGPKARQGCPWYTSPDPSKDKASL